METQLPNWLLEGHNAILRAEAVSLQLSPAHPARGLSNISFQRQSLDGLQPLQIAPQPSAADDIEVLRELYVRHNDLVATYQSLPTRSFETQIYWRGLADGPHGFLIEIIIAVKTELLDSQPLLRAASEAASGEVLIARDPAGSSQPLQWQRASAAKEFLDADVRVVVFRMERAGVSYAEMVHPTDFQGATWERTGPASRLSYTLFPQPLEKGVIRKARVRGAILPREHDTDLAEVWQRDFILSEPPLTV